MTIEFCLAQSDDDLSGIIELQKKNLLKNLTDEELKAEGFLTVQHDFEILKKMNQDEPAVIATVNNKVVGYCLAMTKKFRNDIPVLIPMFETMDQLIYSGNKIADYNYIVSGQVCVDKGFRGQKMLDQLYAYYQKEYASKYEIVMTEISARNHRSLKVHKRIGFEWLDTYTAPGGETWEIVIWDWNKK